MPPPPGRDPRYEMLDVWRGVACLMVVLHHAGFALRWADVDSGLIDHRARWWALALVRWTDLGVPFFFVISGYCIAASLDAHRTRGASPWAFLLRRFRRIYPPYWAALGLFVATTWALDVAGRHRLHDGAYSLELDSPGELNRSQWLGNVTLAETWRPRAFGGSQVNVFTRIAWSLCFEEQFYFVGFVALLVAPRRLVAVLGWGTALIVAFRAFAVDVGWMPSYKGTFLELWHEFAVGLLIYWRLVLAPPGRIRFAAEAAIGALLLAGLAYSYRSTVAASAFGLALIALRRFDPMARRRWLAPLRACGRRCYSIYLVHLPACTVGSEWLVGLGMVDFWARALVMVPVVSAASVGVGWAFFAVVESRFLTPPADRRAHAVALAGEAVPVVAMATGGGD